MIIIIHLFYPVREIARTTTDEYRNNDVFLAPFLFGHLLNIKLAPLFPESDLFYTDTSLIGNIRDSSMVRSFRSRLGIIWNGGPEI